MRDVDIDLRIREQAIRIARRDGATISINGTVPGPLVRLQEGGTATIRVGNELSETTSIHWHGLILPADMDGVPGVSFAGIPAGETFEYHYPVRQNGTYWYHSHSGLQEQLGHYGPLIIDAAEPEPFDYQREHVVVLSDWTFENPYGILARLKKQANYYNRQRRTLAGMFGGRDDGGLGGRLDWARMRMDATDLADVTGATYTYLVNGLAPDDNWTGLFRAGERVRLRFINAAAATFFDVRIPGLELTVVQVDGQNVEPVTVDEFRIANAETYDVLVTPSEDHAYTVFAEAMDRSGCARGTLAPREGMAAEVPERRRRAVRTMADMGMDHGAMEGMDMEAAAADAAGGEHAGHAMPAEPAAAAPPVIPHGDDHHGAGNASVAEMPRSRLHEPGIGLGNDGRRVLLYSDLRALAPLYEHRPPDREIELHATGNMERYMWSFDGRKFSQVDGPIRFRYGERVRITFVNDTMMEHPLHLHGMWLHLDNGNGALNPRKHTVNVKPGERMLVEVEADAPGSWAFHCHILYHMDAGMFRVVEVAEDGVENRAHGETS
jgi:CopA family copper-resistance protein